MHSCRIDRCAPRRTLALAVLAGLPYAVASQAAADPPDIIYVTGTVRDFLKSHPDFNIAGATGHVANNAELANADNRPALMGNGTSGFSVATQWRNRTTQNIAPHLYYNGGALQLAQCFTPPGNVTFDSFNSADGPYGGDNVGGVPPIDCPAPMPTVNPPVGLPKHPSAAGTNSNVHYPAGTHIIDFSFQCRGLTVDKDAVLIIEGNQTIYCTGPVSLGQSSHMHVPVGSRLDFYYRSSFDMAQSGTINMNDPMDPNRCWMYNVGNSNNVFNQFGAVCARIISPNGILALQQGDNFYGTFIGRGITMSQDSGFHWDGIPLYVCENLVADHSGTPGANSAGAITSSSTFAQWFTDVLGTNYSTSHTIALTRNSDGVYEYLDNAFFPIDNMIFGNEGDAHNFNFTFAFSARFRHEQCSDRFFEFMGADDVWVYIDGKLAMDLGGVMPLVPQVIEADRLRLNDGETYTLHFFYAQRNPATSVFRLRTSLPLESSQFVAVTQPFD